MQQDTQSPTAIVSLKARLKIAGEDRSKLFTPGEKVFVRTYGIPEFWHETEFSRHQPATLTNNELFYFSTPSSSFPVTAETLLERARLAEEHEAALAVQSTDRKLKFEVVFSCKNGDTRREIVEAANSFEARMSARNIPGFDWVIDISPKGSIVQPAFKIGDQVRWVNDYGVIWPGRIVLEVELEMGNEPRYYLSPTSSPWMPVRESMIALDPDPMPDVLYHAVIRTNSCPPEAQITEAPVTHKEGLELLSKITDYTWQEKHLRPVIIADAS